MFRNQSKFFYTLKDDFNQKRIEYNELMIMMVLKIWIILNQFKTNKRINVMLISTKCASVGLNLTIANRIIILEPRWNTGLDSQAIGRLWRIGQNKKVYVERIVSESV